MYSSTSRRRKHIYKQVVPSHAQGRVGHPEKGAVSFLSVFPVQTSDTLSWHYSFSQAYSTVWVLFYSSSVHPVEVRRKQCYFGDRKRGPERLSGFPRVTVNHWYQNNNLRPQMTLNFLGRVGNCTFP